MTRKKSFTGPSFLDGAEREQRKMAEELHETLCQSLAGVSLLAQVLVRKGNAGTAIGAADLKRITRYLDQAIDQARLTFQDQSLLSGSIDLTSALKRLAAVTTTRTACAYRDNHTATALSPRTAYALYRIAQEAVRNSLRHAQPRRIELSLTWRKRDVIMALCDDGCGFKKSSGRKGRGRGLDMMQGWADLLSGTLSIKSGVGKGTWVRCVAPIDASADR
jgi:signal transduction histidine kinase